MNLKQMREDALKAAQEIAQKAKDEGRGFSDAEREQIKTHMEQVDDLDTQIKDAAQTDRIMGMFTAETKTPDDTPAGTLGEHFAKSVGEDGFTNLKTRGGYTVSAPEFKAATDVHVVGSVFNTLLTDVDQTVVRPYRRPLVTDLLGTGTLSGNAVTYFVEAAAEGDFTTVAEGAQKPQIHVLDPTTRTDALRKIAAWFDTSDEMVEDLPFMVSEINNRGIYMLSLVEEAQLLNGNGTGTNLLGMLNRSGVQTEASAAAADNADALFRAMTKVQTATGLTADGLIINPLDYQNLRLRKDANGQYYGGGFFSGQYGNGGIQEQPPIWGLRTVVSAAAAAGAPVVGAFKAATTVYRKGGVRVESTNSDLGKFTKNVITTRIEERIALAVRVPAAIVKLTLSAL